MPSDAKPWFLIDPRTSTWIGRWDVFTSLALVFVAFVTPLEIAVFEVSLDTLFLVNRVVDIIFIMDLVFSFVTVYQVNDKYILDPNTIAVHYLKTWFPLDLLSVAISGIDIYVVAQSGDGGGSNTDTLNNLRTLRIVRVLRFFRVLKLLRVMRAARIFARWESKIAINYNTLQLIKSLVMACVTSHWIACFWIIQAFMHDPLRSWLTDSYPYCQMSASSRFMYCREAELLYSASLYHTMLCMFGGLEATPGNGMEMFWATMLMLISGLVWSHVMGTVVSMVTMADPAETDFRQTMDSLNAYMRRELIHPELRQRAREYFQKSKHLQRSDAAADLLERMPYSLQAEFVLSTSKQWLEKVWFLSQLNREDDYPFLVAFARSVNPKVFCPGDWTPSGYLYIIHRGIALYRAGVLTRGRVFGEDFMLTNDAIRDSSCARAMNYLEVYTASRDDVLGLGEQYPETWAKVRKRVLFRTFRKALIQKKDNLLTIINSYRDMNDRGLIMPPPGAIAEKVDNSSSQKPKPPPTPFVERVPAPALQRARNSRNQARQERREGRGLELATPLGSGTMSRSPSEAPSLGGFTRSPSRARIGDVEGYSTRSPTTATRGVAVNDVTVASHEPKYRPEGDSADAT